MRFSKSLYIKLKSVFLNTRVNQLPYRPYYDYTHISKITAEIGQILYA